MIVLETLLNLFVIKICTCFYFLFPFVQYREVVVMYLKTSFKKDYSPLYVNKYDFLWKS